MDFLLNMFFEIVRSSITLLLTSYVLAHSQKHIHEILIFLTILEIYICHAIDGPPITGPPGPSVAATDGPPGPPIAAISSPPDHRWSPC